MIITTVQLVCDDCETAYLPDPRVTGSAVIIRVAAAGDGWTTFGRGRNLRDVCAPCRSTRPCSYPGCGKPTAYLPVETEDTAGMQWRHVDPADEEAAGQPGFMHVGYPVARGEATTNSGS